MEWLREWENRTLVDLIDRAVNDYPKREAVVFKDRRISYKELGEQIDALAVGLLRVGVKKRDKVAVWLSNSPEWIISEFAIIKAGAVVVPLSSRLKGYDVSYILKQSDSMTLIIMDHFLKANYVDILTEIMPGLPGSKPGFLNNPSFPLLKNIICASEKKYAGLYSLKEIMADVSETIPTERLKERSTSLDPDDVVNLPYTSGTTGFPKGVLTTHQQYIGEILVFKERLALQDGDRFLAPAPFFANFGNYFGVLLPLLVGGCTVPLEIFDPEECLRLIEQEKCTHISGTPTMYQDILDHARFPEYDVRSLRTGMTGAAPASVQMIQDVQSKMGLQIICNGYGMTENSGATTMTCPSDSLQVRANTTGKPFPDVQIRIVDTNTNEALPFGSIGELCVKGWIVMKGYYKMPEETQKCFDSEGWFHTGDLGYLDEDGNFCITGRQKDMFISGGQNVYPTEIENFFYSFPKLKQVAVLGVSDDRLGEVGFAFVVLKEGEVSSEEEIKNYAKERIANYKVPKYVKFVKDIPLVGVGKIKKFQLVEDAKEEIQRRRLSS